MKSETSSDKSVLVDTVNVEPNLPDVPPETNFEPVEVKTIENSTNKKIRAKIDELSSKGVSVVYPSNEANWNAALLERLNKL